MRSISVVLDDGEVFKGAWALVPEAPGPSTTAGTAAVVPIDMADDWDDVYGTNYFTVHVLGSKVYARATLTGNKGSVLHVEFNNETNTPGNTKGVAADDKGNVFKVSVYN